MGPEVFEFEALLSNYFNRTALCVSSGTAALHLSIQACNIGKGDEVLVPSITYVASFQAISATGAKPIACDVDPLTLMIDIKDAEKRITEKTKGIMPVFYAGGTKGIGKIYNFSKYHNLRVIEDAAHAFGSHYKGRRVGSFGDITCFSFDGIKNITSGEGGAIVTDDEKIINLVKDIRLLGVEKDTNKRKLQQRSWEFDVSHQGWRYHMSSIMAAIGIEQFKRFESLAQTRMNLSKRYVDQLSKLNRITCVNTDFTEIVPHIFPILISNLKERELLREKLLDKNIQTGVHWKPNHLLSKYSVTDALPFPNTDIAYRDQLTLPLNADMTIDEVDYVCNSLITHLSSNEH
jgi:dTDP-4-amino-4,6-dideoxygalactose transaminase